MYNTFTRKCPSCNNDLNYTSLSHLKLAINNNSVCHNCANIRNRKYKNIENDYYKTCKKCRKILKYSSRRNLIRAIKGNGLCRRCNGKYTDKSGNVGYNFIACQFIDDLNKKMGWKLQHALNGGECLICGYFVDGYDKERNIVFEYDEEYHKRCAKQKDKDLIRQKRILNDINPIMFLRYDKKANVLYDVKSDN